MYAHPFLHLLSLITGTDVDRKIVALALSLTPGANVDPDDIRTVQAAMAWWRKFGGDVAFKDYLESIPQAPDFAALRKEFPTLDRPLLVDPRLGHVRTAELVGLQYRADSTFRPVDSRHAMPTSEPYWVLAHDGTPNHNRPPLDCLADCSGRLLAGTADVLMAIWLQYGPLGYGMDGPGSVSADGGNSGACVHPAIPCLMLGSNLPLRKFGTPVFVRV